VPPPLPIFLRFQGGCFFTPDFLFRTRAIFSPPLPPRNFYFRMICNPSPFPCPAFFFFCLRFDSWYNNFLTPLFCGVQTPSPQPLLFSGNSPHLPCTFPIVVTNAPVPPLGFTCLYRPPFGFYFWQTVAPPPFFFPCFTSSVLCALRGICCPQPHRPPHPSFFSFSD